MSTQQPSHQCWERTKSPATMPTWMVSGRRSVSTAPPLGGQAESQAFILPYNPEGHSTSTIQSWTRTTGCCLQARTSVREIISSPPTRSVPHLRDRATADEQIGEYSFCFENEGSSADKLLDFDIMVESEPRRQLSAQQPALKEHTSTLEESTYKLSGLLSSVIRTQK